ncbi:putative surface protein with fasciclin (FAS1) repeats [Hymenobacter sp. 9A]|uniref:Surface protein with fasciclin (FAS1) repeats n=2 Tax=Hymenobacter caeli TaxID=2735894 RepID=A0ABX2FUS0_9BACT|nr:putative surface protein with fasciclin (FAS1) repeats [Hymenobacter caeli]
MTTKHFLATLGFAFALSAPAFAQTTTSDGGDKTKTVEDGMTTKTKVADDGKMKVKAKTDAGDRMKATTKPRKGDMAGMDMGKGVMVGGAMMTPDKDIVDNAVNSQDHTTLVAAVKAAGLVETLKSTGPFTVFAPTNEAFNKLPAGTVDKLVQPDMKDKLTTILTYHVVPGRLTAADLKDGQTLTTVEGETLKVSKKGKKVMLTDAKGGTATVTIPNIIDSNGVTHVIDAVLMPTK